MATQVSLKFVKWLHKASNSPIIEKPTNPAHHDCTNNATALRTPQHTVVMGGGGM